MARRHLVTPWTPGTPQVQHCWGLKQACSLLEPQTEHSDTGRTGGSLFTPMSDMREWTPYFQKAQTPQPRAFPEIGL